MKRYIDSKIVILNNEKYIVYLKSVPVREGKEGRKEIIRAFVKRLSKSKRKKSSIINSYMKQFSYQTNFFPLLTNSIK